MPQQPQADQFDDAGVKYVQALMNGKEPPPNQYVGDLVEQLRQADVELNRLGTQISHMSDSLEKARQRRIALVGITQQLGLNVVRWGKRDHKPASNTNGS